MTLAASLVGGLDGRMLPSYWLSQLCGAMVGAGMAKVRTAGGGLINRG